MGRAIFALLTLAMLAGCETAPKADEAVTPQNQCRKGAELLGNRFISPEQKRFIFETMRNQGCMGNPAPIAYPGNCLSDDDYDAAGNRCGARSAASRPGGY